MSVEQMVMGLGASRSGSRADQKKAFAELREYCEQHPEEAKAFASSRRVSPEDLLGAFQRGWNLFQTVKGIFQFITGPGSSTPRGDEPPPAA